MIKPVSRRKFLKTGIIVTAAAGAAICGGGAAAATYTPKTDLPSTQYGENKMNPRVLIAYASKAGSTAETAVRMGETLSRRGCSVDVRPVSKVTDLASYQAVVLGSTIRIGSLLPEMMTFVKNNQAALQQKPLSLFIMCMTLEKDNEETRKTVSAYLEPVRALVQPASEGLFAGTMIPGKLSLIERLMMKAMKTPVGDFRQWDQINSWTESIPTA